MERMPRGVSGPKHGHRSRAVKKLSSYLLVVVFVICLCFLSTHNYLLFHSIAELFSIVIAYGIFIIAWNCRHNLEGSYLLLLGIAYLFVGSVDVLHTLAYRGMGVFPRGNADLPTQLWIAARYLEGLSLILAFAMKQRSLKVGWVLAGYGVTFTLILLSVFVWEIFPTISLLFLGAILELLWRRRSFDRTVLRLMISSLAFSIFSETFFIFYVDVYGLSNLFGHVFKILSFFCIYRALITTGLTRPFAVLFRNLKSQRDALEKSERELKVSNATKDRFFSIIAHDLRNPLMSIDLMAQYLQESRGMLHEEEMLNLLKDLENVSKRTLALLNNLLQWARYQTGEIPYAPAPWSLHGILLEGIESLKGYAGSKRIRIGISEGDNVEVLVDRNMIATVVRNLVSNAIKFSEPGSSVQIDSSRRGTMAEVSVRDWGRGMSHEDRAKLFRIDVPFSTPGTMREKGTGLGLVLCRDFVRRHGGEIWLESAVGRGTNVRFTVPLR
jgi:signal transduction histidine kinase